MYSQFYAKEYGGRTDSGDLLLYRREEGKKEIRQKGGKEGRKGQKKGESKEGRREGGKVWEKEKKKKETSLAPSSIAFNDRGPGCY